MQGAGLDRFARVPLRIDHSALGTRGRIEIGRIASSVVGRKGDLASIPLATFVFSLGPRSTLRQVVLHVQRAEGVRDPEGTRRLAAVIAWSVRSERWTPIYRFSWFTPRKGASPGEIWSGSVDPVPLVPDASRELKVFGKARDYRVEWAPSPGTLLRR